MSLCNLLDKYNNDCLDRRNWYSLRKNEVQPTEEADKGSKWIITGMYRGERITRVAYSDLQAFTINNTLARQGVIDLGMREVIRE